MWIKTALTGVVLQLTPGTETENAIDTALILVAAELPVGRPSTTPSALWPANTVNWFNDKRMAMLEWGSDAGAAFIRKEPLSGRVHGGPPPKPICVHNRNGHAV